MVAVVLVAVGMVPVSVIATGRVPVVLPVAVRTVPMALLRTVR